MRTLSITALLLCLSGVALAKNPNEAEDEQSIAAGFNKFAQAWNKHDPAAMAAQWATDGTLINPFGKEAKGREAVQKLFEEEQSKVMKKTTFAYSPLQIRFVKPDIALVDTTCTISGMTKPNGEAMPAMKSHASFLMVKAGNEWRVSDGRAFNFMPPPKNAPVGRHRGVRGG